MPKATCRCGQKLSLPVNGPERVVCPKCGARVRVRRDSPAPGGGDGFARFNCPCGRRLKVRADAATATLPQAGKCPDCGRVVPVPGGLSSTSQSGPVPLKGHGAETPTEEMSPTDFSNLEQWAEKHLGGPAPAPAAAAVAQADVAAAIAAAATLADEPRPPVKVEAGLRVCPRCGRPIHMSAVACRECGAPVPKR